MKRASLFLVSILCCVASVMATPAQVILIRHAEKPIEGDALSLKGRERVMALVPFFYGSPTVLSYGLPAAIYAAKSLTRTLLTVKPLAEKLDLPVVNAFSHQQIQPLVDDILHNPDYEGKMVMVCWSHEEMPRLASLLGAKKTPKVWSEKSYDRLWVLNYDDAGDVTFKDLPQKLLYGDSPK